MADLIVDGHRPSVGWVSRLPRKWTTPRERLVLLALAADAYGSVSAPGVDDLATWCGMFRGDMYDLLAELQSPTGRRPALLERVDEDGNPLPDDAPRGGRGRRTHYRLRTELDPANSPENPGRNTPINSPDNPGQFANSQPSGESRTVMADKPSGETVRGNRPGKPSGKSRTLPIPIPTPALTSTDQVQNARETVAALQAQAEAEQRTGKRPRGDIEAVGDTLSCGRGGD